MQHKLAILLALAAAALLFVNHQQPKDHYLEWKQQFGMVYASEEDSFRKLIFL
jgi:hypothetical protein